MNNKYGSPMMKDGAIGRGDTMESTWDKFQKQLQEEDEVFEYKGTFSFKSDQELTQEQLDQIVFAIQVQMEEPADENGNDEEFSTREVLVSLEVSE